MRQEEEKEENEIDMTIEDFIMGNKLALLKEPKELFQNNHKKFSKANLVYF